MIGASLLTMNFVALCAYSMPASGLNRHEIMRRVKAIEVMQCPNCANLRHNLLQMRD
jgi:hypothetical protein